MSSDTAAGTNTATTAAAGTDTAAGTSTATTAAGPAVPTVGARGGARVEAVAPGQVQAPGDGHVVRVDHQGTVPRDSDGDPRGNGHGLEVVDPAHEAGALLRRIGAVGAALVAALQDVGHPVVAVAARRGLLGAGRWL